MRGSREATAVALDPTRDPTGGMDVLDDDKLLLAATYWSLIRGDRAYPLRTDLDPCAMPPGTLPWICLIEVSDNRYRYRLVGTGLREYVGRDVTGDFVENLSDNQEYNDYIVGLLEDIRKHGSCIYSQVATQAGSDVRKTNRLVAPMSKKGDAIDMFFCCQTFDSHADFTLTSALTAISKDQPVMLKTSAPRKVLFKELHRFRLDI